MSQAEIQQIMTQLALMHQDIKTTSQTITDIKNELYGDGSDDNPGLKNRVMKQAQYCQFVQNAKGTHLEHRWLLYAAALGSLLMIAADILTRLFH